MSDLIERQAAIDALVDAGIINYTATGNGNGMIHAVNVIKGLPSAQLKHGKWMGTVCSSCGESTSFYYDCDYCPNCGAKMDAERKDNGK